MGWEIKAAAILVAFVTSFYGTFFGFNSFAVRALPPYLTFSKNYILGIHEYQTCHAAVRDGKYLTGS